MNTVQSETAVSSSVVAVGSHWERARAGCKTAFQHAKRIFSGNLFVASMVLKHRPLAFAFRLVLVALMVGVPFLMSWSSGELIEAVVSGQKVQALDLAAIGLALALLISGALPLMVAVLDKLLENWAFAFVQQSQVSKVPELDPVTYSDPDLKNKIQQVQERSVWRIMGFVRSQIMLLRGAALALIAAYMLAHFDLWLCLLIVMSMLPSMVQEGLHAYRQFKVDERQGEWWRRFWEVKGNLMSSVAFPYLIVFDAAHWYAQRFAGQIGDAIGEYDVVERRSIGVRAFNMVLGMSATVFVAYVLLNAVMSGAISVSAFVFYLGALSLLGASLADIASAVGQQLGQSLYVASFQEVMELESQVQFPVSGQKPQVTEHGVTLELRDVRFSYPMGAGKARREVIRGVDVFIPAGEKWALVGVNGAGKSTLSALLSRLFDPDQGQVLVGGVAASDMDRRTLRTTIGVLPQHILHFNLTVQEFITLGRAGEVVDEKLLHWAAARSGAAAFIEQYPKGYAQPLGRDYHGAEEPSGGQLQKLALASLLYMQCPLMVLDEPTAAIDPEAARDFWDSLFHESPGQTVVFSTHYLGAVRRANRILVFDSGRILDCGTHDELMRSCDVYRKLFESQARDFRV